MIRSMEVLDIDPIFEIENLSFSTPWTRSAFETELTNDNAHYIVITVEDKVIGYGGFWKIMDEAHFTNLAIHPEYRGKGYGKQLIQGMLDLAKQIDIKYATLEVRASNEHALKAYSTLGFYIEGKRSRYYTNPVEDALIMWASLK